MAADTRDRPRRRRHAGPRRRAAAAPPAGGDYGGEHPDYEKALAGSPAPLAACTPRRTELLPGGSDAYEKRIAALRGYPVVVNVWASWCGPCRFEFPIFQQARGPYGKRVAFLGIDCQDSDDAARPSSTRPPVPYPSYTDPDRNRRQRSAPTSGFPTPPSTTARQTRLPQAGPVRHDSELRSRHRALRARRQARKRIIETWNSSSSSP